MGESIAEATITKWLKDVGDNVEIDESLVEIATDKVDSDVPSEYKGKLIKKNFEVNDVVKVGEVIAEIETDMIDNDNTIIKSKEIKDEIMVEDAKDEIMVEDVKDEISNEDVLQDIPSIELLDKENITSVRIKSPITCGSTHGICAKSYGRDLAKGVPVNLSLIHI